VQIKSIVEATRAVHVKEVMSHSACGSYDPNPMISLDQAQAFYRQILKEGA
jgi:hypothetical protein